VGGAAPGPSCREAPAPGRRGKAVKPPRGRGYLPREVREMIFDEVRRLYREGLGYKRVRKELLRRFEFAVPLSTIACWVRGIHTPFGPMPALRPNHYPHRVDLKPSPELAYVIGVVLGDGYVCRTGYNYLCCLMVKDREFVEEFARSLSVVLGRPVRVTLYKPRGRYTVQIRSRELYELLRKPRDTLRLKDYIEHCTRCIAAFLRGLCDAEGSVDINLGNIYIANSNLKLLKYIQGLSSASASRQQGLIL